MKCETSVISALNGEMEVCGGRSHWQFANVAVSVLDDVPMLGAVELGQDWQTTRLQPYKSWSMHEYMMEDGSEMETSSATMFMRCLIASGAI